MLVGESMTSPVVTIGPDEELGDAARLLDSMNLTCLPVVDHALRMLGIVSEADVIACLASGSVAPGQPPRVSALMTRRVLSVAPEDDLSNVMDLMTGAVLKSLPVVLQGRVVGMISRRDVIRRFALGDLDAPPNDQLSPA
jgi:CBS domain-containing protein